MCLVRIPSPGEFLNIADVLLVSRNEFGSATITVLATSDPGAIDPGYMIVKLLNEFVDTGTFHLLRVISCEHVHVFAHPSSPHLQELARLLAQAALFL
ncbi:MAG: hypothetical protein A3C02_04090 [Candidatus Andersenbacteria bacterium RIFCSPHIGHO2_02_FULL_45_11]|uniref:Uncharacterized protein n=1 Tax=Candidatus Andersenbacteria bacterium RIFCSPHIGHO2_12_FULL_45_11 TaxID=1797281 RepID=A0A1G1WZV1_9BACT|nr:MAG: hypothetical protein A2805_00800 [Candidatus Andersenbacteria bacterium RIFCSPHIGHO2_01_FULL_46_36]OGY33071.1 MAG: hypothetical protein A3D99_01280 [Candidatus Andersenbacteria bacterium RIFCSPHIGHO2_12_FULL_45_11]OGY33410.1 MAG: hypothetical protein A3C02_04090 [Candidatus Andersenbacteria bacterium RIFCSPHIGHO2_02_FULL_45_11]